MKTKPFTLRPGEVIARKKLHAIYGGQERGGISTPAGRPYIFVFTGARGEAFGYEHAWESEIYHYTGEGQRGDMEFAKGNKALRDAMKDEKRIYLFAERPDGMQEYVAEMEVHSWRHKEQKDAGGKMRQSIVFELRRVPPEPEPTSKGLTLAER
jgi:5-methylcytosine-specific restriction protein A